MEIKKIGKIPTEKDLQEYLQQRIIPVRFCYPGKGGNKWHKLRCNDEYKLGERELTAFNGSLSEIKKIIENKPINLVHLGPGDGVEIPYLFETFKPNGNGRYAGVDISKQMIQNTFQLNKSYFSNIKPLWYLTNIETKENLELICKDVKNEGTERNLILLTNQGVLFSNSETLENVFDSMQKQDYLFITIEGDDANKRDEICATYNLPEVKDLLSIGLKRAEYNPNKGKFKTIFNEEKSRVEVYFKPKYEKEILCLTSYKPKEDEFRNKLNESGFDIEFLKFYKEAHTFAVLCKKKEIKNV